MIRRSNSRSRCVYNLLTGALVLAIGTSVMDPCLQPVFAKKSSLSNEERLIQRLEKYKAKLSDAEAQKDDDPGEYITALYRLSSHYRGTGKKEKSVELSLRLIDFYLECDYHKVKTRDARNVVRSLNDVRDSISSEQLESYLIGLLTRYESLKLPARECFWLGDAFRLSDKIGKEKGVEKKIDLSKKWIAIRKRHRGPKSEDLYILLLRLKGLYRITNDTRQFKAIDSEIANLDFPPGKKAELKVERASRRVEVGDIIAAQRDWDAACKFVSNDFSKVEFHHILSLLDNYRERGMYQEVNGVLDILFNNPSEHLFAELEPILTRMLDEYYESGSLDAARSLIQRRIAAGAKLSPANDPWPWRDKLVVFKKATGG